MKNIILYLTVIMTCNILVAQDVEILFETNFNGETQGSLEKLIEHVRSGTEIRVGWAMDFDGDGLADVEHWAPCEFISVYDGHVYNQIRNIHQQSPGPGGMKISGKENYWYALIGTDGIMQHKFILEQKPVLDFEGVDISDEEKQKIIDNLSKVKEERVQTKWVID